MNPGSGFAMAHGFLSFACTGATQKLSIGTGYAFTAASIGGLKAAVTGSGTFGNPI
jgi:hypothetical protein